MKLLSEEEIRKHVMINKQKINQVSSAFSDLIEKDVSMPPVMRVIYRKVTEIQHVFLGRIWLH